LKTSADKNCAILALMQVNCKLCLHALRRWGKNYQCDRLPDVHRQTVTLIQT